MPGRMRHGRFSSRNTAQQPKWMSVPPPKLRFALHSMLSNNPFNALNETDDNSLRRIKLNAFNTVLTASKSAIDFISSTTDRTYNDARTLKRDMQHIVLAPPILSQRTLPPTSTELISLNIRSQRTSKSELLRPGANGNSFNVGHTKFIGASEDLEQQSHLVSLRSEAQTIPTSQRNMVRSPLTKTSTKPRKSKSPKDLDVTLKPETTPIVIRSYTRDKLITTVLDWYKKHPHPDNPKSTDIRRLLKKELLTKVFDIQELMRAEKTVQDLRVTTPKATSTVVTPFTQASSQNTSNLEVEDIQRLIGEKYFELNGKSILLTSLHGKTKRELLHILNTMEPEHYNDTDIDDNDDDEVHYEEEDSDDETSMVTDVEICDDASSVADLSISDSVKKCLEFVSDSESDNSVDDESGHYTNHDDNDDANNYSRGDDESVTHIEDNDNDITDQDMESIISESNEENEQNDALAAEADEDPSVTSKDEFPFDDEALAQLDIDTNVSSTQPLDTYKRVTRSSTKVMHNNSTPISTSKKSIKKTSTNKPTKFRGLGYGAERLNGCDISDLVPAQVSDSYSDHNNNKVIVKKVERLDIYIRPRLHVHENKHAPSMIKSFIRVLRQIDPSLVLLPLDPNDTSLNHILQDEKQLPENENDMARWIAKVRYNVHKKLCFSARISMTMDIQEFKSHAFPWCRTHQHWITFDEIKATETFTAGWLCGLHHKNVDVDALKTWICSQDTDNDFNKLLKIYPRKIWQSVPDTSEKRMTEVLAIDASAECSDMILKFLYSIKWTGLYDTVKLVPMKINDAFTAMDMLRAIDMQNAHRNSEYCKSIVIPNHSNVFTMANGSNITFLDWASQCEIRGTNIFRNVYASDDDYVKFVYTKDRHNEVRKILSNLFDTVEKKFSSTVAEALFTSRNAFKSSLNIKEAELEYLQATAASFRSNPQSTDLDTSYKPRDNKIIPAFGPVKALETISYSQVAQSSTKTTNVTEHRLQDLEKKMNFVIESVSATKVNNEDESTSKEFKLVYEMINTNKKNADKKIESVVQQVKDSEKRNKQRITKSYNSMTKLMIALHRKTLSELKPSSSTKRRHGGSQ